MCLPRGRRGATVVLWVTLFGWLTLDVLGKRDTDSISYLIESEERVDARKPLFYTLASKGWPLVGLEGMELSLEDIFIRLVGEQRKGRNTKGGKN